MWCRRTGCQLKTWIVTFNKDMETHSGPRVLSYAREERDKWSNSCSDPNNESCKVQRTSNYAKSVSKNFDLNWAVTRPQFHTSMPNRLCGAQTSQATHVVNCLRMGSSLTPTVSLTTQQRRYSTAQQAVRAPKTYPLPIHAWQIKQNGPWAKTSTPTACPSL